MKNLKITGKLIVGFGIVIVMLLVIGIVGVVNLNRTSKDINYLATASLPTTNALWQMRRDFVSIESGMYKAIATTVPAETTEFLDGVKVDVTNLLDGLKYLRTQYTGPVSDLDNLESLINEASTTITKIEELAKKFTTADNLAAANVLNTTYQDVYSRESELLLSIHDAVDGRITTRANGANSASTTAVVVLIIIVLFSLLPTVIVVTMITNSIRIPVAEIEAAAIEMSHGRLDAIINYTAKDELGSLAHSIRQSMRTLKEYVTDISANMDKMSSGDMTFNIDIDYIGDFAPIKTAMQNILASLNSTLGQISEASSQVSSGSDQVSSGAQALSQGATEQASAVEELSASINEISEQVKATATNASSASRKASVAGSEISGSNEQMQNMIVAMDEITSKSNEIGKIIKTIDDIAFQTNILALNAAVEAARAGAAGKGFAVVADEVRNLAGKSADAAKNTTMLIEETVAAVSNGSRIANETAERLNATVTVAQEAVAIIDDIARSSGDQATSISQVTQGVEQISSVVQTNSATAEESAAAAEELSGQATMLNSAVAMFQLKGVQNNSRKAAPRASYSAPISYQSGSDKY